MITIKIKVIKHTDIYTIIILCGYIDYLNQQLFVLESLKSFLVEYCVQDGGTKNFKYSTQLTKLAHREQVALNIELDDVSDYDESLAKAIVNNTRRYVNMMSDIVYELLPTFKEHDVVAKDSLDVYIEHRLMMENRMRQPNEQRDVRNKFPPELMRR